MQPENKTLYQNRGQTEEKKTTFICPVCKSKKELKLPKSIVEEKKNLTTVSIPKGMMCEHQFQAFVDKQFKVRGYQRVDFEFETNKLHKQDGKTKGKIEQENDSKFLNNLSMDGNFIKYDPNFKENTERISNEKKSESKLLYNKPDENLSQSSESNIKSHKKSLGRSLEEIYEEFREFVKTDKKTFLKINQK